METTESKPKRVRKSTVAKQKVADAETKMQEIESLKIQALEEQKKAEEEEAQRVLVIKDRIEDICKEEGLFCGAILSRKQILQIVEIAMVSKDETVKIPFALYHTD